MEFQCSWLTQLSPCGERIRADERVAQGRGVQEMALSGCCLVKRQKQESPHEAGFLR